MNTLHFKRLLLGMLFWVAVGVAQAAPAAEFLGDDAVAEADAGSIKAEAELFARVRDGVMLSLAECDMVDNCSPSVDTREVEILLEKIDTRITTLANRYTETNNKVLEEALLIYADAREDYARALDRLAALPGSGDASLGEDQFEQDLDKGDFSDLFKDTDEDL